MNEKILKLYLDLALERQRVWNKKEQGLPKPWTENQLFLKYFFTNVFRDQDKVSQWIIKNVVPAVNEYCEMWGYIMFYRFVGRIEVFEEIKMMFNTATPSWGDLQDYMFAKEDRNEKIVTGAYIVNSAGTMRKMRYIFKTIELIARDYIYIEPAIKDNSIERATNFFQQFSGIGGFMAYEYATDLTYTKFLNKATDSLSWANLGPGCNRGLNLVKGNISDLNKKNKNYLEDFNYILNSWKHYFSDSKYDAEVPSVIDRLRNPVMRDIEHWLCEFSKYVKYSSSSSFKHRTYPGAY